MRPSVTDALTKALFEEWAETGYGALSLEKVAKRAGAGKAALYRRWSSKLAMVVDCLAKIDLDLAAPETPDAGSLEGDIKLWLTAMRDLLHYPLIRRILPDLQSEMLRSPELAEASRERLDARFTSNAALILQRAIGRRGISKNIDQNVFGAWEK